MTLDRRLNAYRPDLADEVLWGQVEAARFTAGEPACVVTEIADLRGAPVHEAGIDTQLLFGERVTVLERKDGWAWVKAAYDGYVGYLPETALSDGAITPTHWVIQPRTFVYPEPDLKKPQCGMLSVGSRITVTEEVEVRGTRYLRLDDGRAVIAAHCAAPGERPLGDYVAIASRLVETPYLWGGKSAFGIDCSGLVQLSMMMAGQWAPRDSDMQAAGLGVEIAPEDIGRGDLVFWKGHVAIMEDEETLIHANGNTMSVAREGLEAAISRIGYLYGDPVSCRRP